ncbi:hypothetical protein J5260_06955 [Luteovulum azotoformans]|nr:hypothetical protein [Cereibacter azotoformans]MBO4169131.1 hypothetical protein [Cereibacter azotoformans]
MPMPRRTIPQQLDLFDPPCAAGSLPLPDWRSLPDETQATLTGLMVRLILDHADGADGQRKEAGHDA